MGIAVAAALAVTGVVFCITASDRTRLTVATFLAVPQVFVGPLGQLSLPLSQCWVILMALCWWVEREDPSGARTALKAVLGRALVAAVFVWVFRLVPAVEMAFLRSPAAALAAGPDVMAAFWGESANNVMDVAKAGGFVINATVASMFLGVATFACLVLLVDERRRRYLAAALVIWSATFATGSKTAAALALLLPVVVRAVHLLGRPAARPPATGDRGPAHHRRRPGHERSTCVTLGGWRVRKS